eukprot:3485714-Prymnesium_polylepis.1
MADALTVIVVPLPRFSRSQLAAQSLSRSRSGLSLSRSLALSLSRSLALSLSRSLALRDRCERAMASHGGS